MRLTPALAAAAVVTTALLAGGGGAVAGSMITGAQIKNNTVASADIKNGSLLRGDLNPATVKALAGKTGPRGLPGVPGPQGLKGEQGLQGIQGIQGIQGVAGQTGASGPLAGYEIVVASKPLVAGVKGSILAVDCPTGKSAIGGGGYFSTSNQGVALLFSPDRVSTTVDNPSTTTADTINLKVVCASTS